MSVSYRPISWDRQKKIYDGVLATGLLIAGGLFAGLSGFRHPEITIETLIIRTTAVLALVLLHVILCIGPLARLDSRFLPLLYNRRHLGVVMFLLASAHAVFSVIQFHALGDENPLVSVFTSYQRDYDPFAAGSFNISRFPFEPFGVVALLVLFIMAATSHDFWLKNMGAGFWKLLHLGVYGAYGLILVHVFFGALQSERSPLLPILIGAGFASVAALHIAAARKERQLDAATTAARDEGFVDTCSVDELQDLKGKVVLVGKERIAVYRRGDRVFALSNVCRHQGGPIGEGRIVDGCVTCPWHGWNYKVEDGCSPPPFQEVLVTYNVRTMNGRVLIHPTPNPPKTRCEGALVRGTSQLESLQYATVEG